MLLKLPRLIKLSRATCNGTEHFIIQLIILTYICLFILNQDKAILLTMALRVCVVHSVMIFRNEQYKLFEMQTEIRDELKNEAKNVIDDLISNIDSDVYVSDKMVELFRKLDE